MSPGVFNYDSSFLANISVLRPCSANISIFKIESSSNFSLYSLSLEMIAISAPLIKLMILPSENLLTTTLIRFLLLSNSKSIVEAITMIKLLEVAFLIIASKLQTREHMYLYLTHKLVVP